MKIKLHGPHTQMLKVAQMLCWLAAGNFGYDWVGLTHYTVL